MEILKSHYRNAQQVIRTIEQIKHDMDAVLNAHSFSPYAEIHINQHELRHAISCIHDVIDDLFVRDSRQAKYVMEAWEQKDRLRAAKEWQTSPGIS